MTTTEIASTVVIDHTELRVRDVITTWRQLCTAGPARTVRHALWDTRVRALCGPGDHAVLQLDEPSVDATEPQPIPVLVLHNNGTTETIATTCDADELTAAAATVLAQLRHDGETISATIRAHPLRRLPAELDDLLDPAPDL